MGEPLTDKIDVFIAIGSANYGLKLCSDLYDVDVCNKVTGFYPGTGSGPGEYLRLLNGRDTREA